VNDLTSWIISGTAIGTLVMSATASLMVLWSRVNMITEKLAAIAKKQESHDNDPTIGQLRMDVSANHREVMSKLDELGQRTARIEGERRFGYK